MLYFKHASSADTPGQLADGQHKCCTKRCLEFKKNVASCMNFVGQPTCQLETLCAHYLS